MSHQAFINSSKELPKALRSPDAISTYSNPQQRSAEASRSYHVANTTDCASILQDRVHPRQINVLQTPNKSLRRVWKPQGTMVLAEKGSNNDGGPRNGRRSRGPSPNGLHHQQADSTSEDETSVPVDKIRVGRDYQAVCPELQPETLRKPELIADRALLVWSPTADIAESKLEDYIVLAKDKYGYNGEQALGMLFWHKHDLERAVLDLANFTPFPDEWSVEDKVLFEQAFQFHGKSFHRIRQMLPDKSIASLVKYYYGWKKTRSRTSLMDKQARKLQSTAAVAGKSAGCGNTGGDDANAPQSAAPSGGDHNNTSEPNSGNDDSDREESTKNISYSGKVPIQPKQTLTLKRKHSDAIDDNRTSNDRTACRWTHEELTLAVEGVRKYGKDFKAIADALGGNKSEHHVRAFYINYRKKYGLDTVFREWEKEHSVISTAQSTVVAIGIATTTNNNGKSKSNSRPIMARDNNNTGLLISEQNKHKSLTPTVIDIDDDDDDEADGNNSDNASDVICISPSPPPSQPLPAPSTNNLSITAATNGKVIELATATAQIPNIAAALVVSAQALK